MSKDFPYQNFEFWSDKDEIVAEALGTAFYISKSEDEYVISLAGDNEWDEDLINSKIRFSLTKEQFKLFYNEITNFVNLNKE